MNFIQRIRATQRRIGLADEPYYDLVQAVSGQRHTRSLTMAQQLTVLKRLEGLSKGAQSRPGSAGRAAGPFAGKLQALWMALHDLGAVKDRTDPAMMAFVERQTGLSHTRFLSAPADARKAIEALKAIARRHGAEWLSDRTAEGMGLTPVQADRWAILIAQARILRQLNADAEIQAIAFADIHKPLSPEQLLERQILLGRHIRQCIAKQGEA